MIKDLIEKLLQNKKISKEVAQKIINKLSIIPNFPIILIAGTNGKGSTAAYLTNILIEGGYKVGTFTSPHIFDYNERIRINNVPVEDRLLEESLEAIIEEEDVSLFAAFTLAAQYIFIKEKIEIAIIEAGIGGRNDITNIFEPYISVITNVDFDHCNILGNTLEEIGLEKAGVYRNNKYCFYGSINIPNSIIEYANTINAKLQIINRDFSFEKSELSFNVSCQDNNYYNLPYPSMRGEEQLNNATLAIAIINKLSNKFPLSISAIKNGLIKTSLIGRFQIIPGQPQIILDVAHNYDAVSKMIKNMLKLPYANKNYAVFSIAKDKDVDKIIELCKNVFHQWFIAEINSNRTYKVEDLKNLLFKSKINVEESISITEAYNKALKMATHKDRVICFGSFLVVDEVYRSIYKRN